MSSVREVTSAAPSFEPSVEPEPLAKPTFGLKPALSENTVSRHEPLMSSEPPAAWGDAAEVPLYSAHTGVVPGADERLASQVAWATHIAKNEGADQGLACLAHLASNALKSGDRAGARVLCDEMKKDPFRAASLDLMPKGEFPNTTYARSKFTVAGSAVAEMKVAQLEMSSRMERALGGPVALDSVAGARAYFDQFAQSHSVKALGEEFHRYLDAGFVHSGGGVQWPGQESDERARNLQPLIDAQPVDGAGRRVIDCEGFAYLAHSILGGIENDVGGKRFSVNYATIPGHVIAVVGDPSTGEMLLVNNEKVTSKRAKNAEDVYLAVGHELLPGHQKNTATAFGYAARQENAKSLDGLVEWVPGAVAFDGRHARVLNEATARAFNKEFHDWQHGRTK